MADIDFVHLGDTHLGYRQYGLDERFKDWGRATKQVIDYAVDNDVDAVIHSGDLFNSNKADQDALLQAIQIFEPLKEENIPLLVIEGNHDRRRGRQKNTAIDVLDRLNYCEFLDPSGKDISGTIYEINGYNFIGLGYPGIYLERWIDDFTEKLPEDGKNIVLLHAGVEGYIERMASHITAGELMKLEEKSSYLALGHYHDSFRLNNWAFNPGSVERWEFDTQRRPKIFYHVEMEGESVNPNEVEIDTRKMHYFKIDAENSWKDVVEQCEERVQETDLEGAMVRVVVHGKLESEFRRWEIEEIFEEKPLVLKVFDETYSEERESEWEGMEDQEIEKEILISHFEGAAGDPEELADFTKSVLDRILDLSPSSKEEAAVLAEDIANWRRENA